MVKVRKKWHRRNLDGFILTKSKEVTYCDFIYMDPNKPILSFLFLVELTLHFVSIIIKHNKLEISHEFYITNVQHVACNPKSN